MPLPPVCAPQHPSFAPSVVAFLRRAQISSDLCRFTGMENPEESEPEIGVGSRLRNLHICASGTCFLLVGRDLRVDVYMIDVLDLCENRFPPLFTLYSTIVRPATGVYATWAKPNDLRF